MRAAFIDIETSGLDPHRHCVLEIAIKVSDIGTGEVLGSFETFVSQSRDRWDSSDPESLKVTGIDWESVCSGMPESIVCERLKAFLSTHGIRRGEAVFIAQNSSFDRAFFSQLVPVYDQEALKWPYHWLDLASMYWAKRYLAVGNPSEISQINLSKNDIAHRYGLPPEETPHRAMNGVDHLITCYYAVYSERS